MISPAQAAHEVVLECGDIITENTVLGADIGPCGNEELGEGHGADGHALRVRASNVTVDLNGYTIFGLGGTDVLHQASGIKVDQQNNVTIFSSRPGGTIRDFFHGVWILGGNGNQVGNLNIIDNNDGVPPGGGNGIVMQNATNSKVVGNFVDRSGGFGGISIFNDRRVPPCCPQLAEANLIKDNVVRNAAGRVATVGISVEGGSRHRVEGNLVEGSAGDGIRLGIPVSATRVIGNEVRGNGRDGIHLQEDFVTGNSSDRNLVQGNQVGRNARDGIQVNGENNRILNNTSLQNTGFDLFDRKPDCDNNTWSGNVFGTAEPVCTTGP
jgi:parallel beta-helix repeat protein